MGLKLYPDAFAGRLPRLFLDIVVLFWVGGWTLAGWGIYRAVLGLEVAADAIANTGRTFNRWVAAFQGVTPQGIPGLSSTLAELGRTLQRSAGDPVIRQGVEAHSHVEQLAVGLGLAVALAPIALALAVYLPWRWRDASEMAAAEAFFSMAERTGRVEDAKAMLAFRAVGTLPLRQLMRLTPDPIGDLAARRYEVLAGAMMRRLGLRPPSPPT